SPSVPHGISHARQNSAKSAETLPCVSMRSASRQKKRACVSAGGGQVQPGRVRNISLRPVASRWRWFSALSWRFTTQQCTGSWWCRVLAKAAVYEAQDILPQSSGTRRDERLLGGSGSRASKHPAIDQQAQLAVRCRFAPYIRREFKMAERKGGPID